MSQATPVFDAIWDKLTLTLNRMLRLEPIPTNVYTDLYSTVQNYFGSTEYETDLLAKRTSVPVTPNSNETHIDHDEVIRSLPGSAMYLRLKSTFNDYLQNTNREVQTLREEEFLVHYAKTWEKYRFSSRAIDGIFAVMNRRWILRQREKRISCVYDVYTMAMHLWQDIFFKNSDQSLLRTCLKLIEESRNGKQVNTSLVQQTVQSYNEASFTEEERNNLKGTLSLATYREYFEKPYLNEIEQYYERESSNYPAEKTIIEYMREITKRLAQEKDLAERCLHPTTHDKVKLKLEEILIQKKISEIVSVSNDLLKSEVVPDLSILHGLVRRRDKDNKEIQGRFEKYVHTVGLEIIEVRNNPSDTDPERYVQSILEAHKKFFNIIVEAFDRDNGYIIALDKAFSKFVNNNVVTVPPNKSAKSAEILAKYCDTLLRKGNKANDAEFQEQTNEIMIVFNYIDDKDVFQKFYGRLLAKRLVNQLSAADDLEEMLITSLKTLCGFEYTSKFQRMFQDMTGSKLLNDEYRQYCKQKGSDDNSAITTAVEQDQTNNTKQKIDKIVDFSVMVLSSNSWIFSPSPSFILPLELKQTFDSFTHFYTQQHNGRKLTWLHQHSKGELQTLYTKSRHTFLVSTSQMVVLLLFNKLSSWTVQQMQDETQMQDERRTKDRTQINIGPLLQVLCGLLKSKIITCSDVNGKKLELDFKESDIQMDFLIHVNENFTSKNIRVNLNVPQKVVEQKDTEILHQTIDEDRKMVIQAAIVRTMKARQKSKHALLMQEVIEQLKSRFKPQIPIIKKCIDLLIEREYLERDQQERDILVYKA